MKIFTPLRSALFLIGFICLFQSQVFAINSKSTGGYWLDPNTWVGGVVPGVNDAVTIVSNSSPVTIDTDAVAASMNIIGNLTVLATNSLTVSGVLTIDKSTFALNAGLLNLTGSMNIVGNGNSGVGELLITSGTAIVGGSIYFWKDAVNGATNGNDASRLLDISGSGTLSLGGSLVGSNGTNAATLSKTTTGVLIFKGGNTGNFWDQSNNWTNGSVPTSTSQVIIPEDKVVNLQNNQTVSQVKLYSGATINFSTDSLTLTGNFLNYGGSFGTTGTLKFSGTSVDQTYFGTVSATIPNLTIDKLGKTLLLTGLINVTGVVKVTAGTLSSSGNLTLISTASSFANVATIPTTTPTSSITGNVNVQSYFSGGYRTARLISPPINDLTTTSVYKQLQTYVYVTGTGTGMDAGTKSLGIYDETRLQTDPFVYVTNIDNKATPGVGFQLVYKGNRNSAATTPGAVTVTYTGPINQGNVVVPITYTNNATDPHNGYNSVGNPYQATIDFIALYNSQTTLIENQYRALIPSTAGTFTYTNGVSNNLAVVSNTNGRYIAPGQGFYVIKKSGATGSLTFTEAHKAVSTTPARLLSIPNDQRLAVTQNSLSSVSSVSSPKKVLRLNLQNSLHTDETTLVLGDGYDSNFKVEDDATYMTGSSVSLSSYSADGKSLAVNFMPNVKMVSEVKLKVNASTSGPVKLNFTDLSAAGNYIVTLKDNYTNTSTDISINSVYEFEIDKNVSASFGAERFELLFKAPPTLPISLNSFNAVPIEATAELKWETDMERNANYFELERSTDGKNFIKIVEVKAAGNSDAPLAYSFLDKNPLTGKNYYQLKQVIGDGKVSYSEIVSVSFESLREKKKTVTLYPNPAVNVNEVNIKFTANIFDNITLKVKDLTGREIKSISYNNLTSDGVIIQDISSLNSGLYIIELSDVKTNESIGTLKLIKQ